LLSASLLWVIQQEDTDMRLASSAVYNAVMMLVLREADGVFRRQLGLDKRAPDAPITPEELNKNPRWVDQGLCCTFG
jgi:nucleolar complex protein 2